MADTGKVSDTRLHTQLRNANGSQAALLVPSSKRSAIARTRSTTEAASLLARCASDMKLNVT